jgi:hypothetical protein
MAQRRQDNGRPHRWIRRIDDAWLGEYAKPDLRRDSLAGRSLFSRYLLPSDDVLFSFDFNNGTKRSGSETPEPLLSCGDEVVSI